MTTDARYAGWLHRQKMYSHWNLQRFKTTKRLGLLPKPKEWKQKTLALCRKCRKGYWLEDGHGHSRQIAGTGKNHKRYNFYYDKSGKKTPTF